MNSLGSTALENIRKPETNKYTKKFRERKGNFTIILYQSIMIRIIKTKNKQKNFPSSSTVIDPVWVLFDSD